MTPQRPHNGPTMDPQWRPNYTHNYTHNVTPNSSPAREEHENCDAAADEQAENGGGDDEREGGGREGRGGGTIQHLVRFHPTKPHTQPHAAGGDGTNNSRPPYGRLCRSIPRIRCYYRYIVPRFLLGLGLPKMSSAGAVYCVKFKLANLKDNGAGEFTLEVAPTATFNPT